MPLRSESLPRDQVAGEAGGTCNGSLRLAAFAGAAGPMPGFLAVGMPCLFLSDLKVTTGAFWTHSYHWPVGILLSESPHEVLAWVREEHGAGSWGHLVTLTPFWLLLGDRMSPCSHLAGLWGT